MANSSGTPVPIGRVLTGQIFVLSAMNFIVNFGLMQAIGDRAAGPGGGTFRIPNQDSVLDPRVFPNTRM